MTTTQRVASNVRTIARHRNMTMKALAADVGFKNTQVLFTRLSGETKLSVDELAAIAEALGVRPEDLLGDPFGQVIHQSPWTFDSAGAPRQLALDLVFEEALEPVFNLVAEEADERRQLVHVGHQAQAA